MVIIRKAKIEDLEGITSIYNDAIKKTVATFDTEIKTLEEQKVWFKDHGLKNPIVVAEENSDIIGWAALSKWSDRCAYSDTAEISIYVKEDYQKKGIGKKLMNQIVKEGGKAGLHLLIARITDGNPISIHLHELVGFTHIGIMKECGFKFGKRLDVILMQKLYKNNK
jgi:phosphinothricin acetyltransferase